MIWPFKRRNINAEILGVLHNQELDALGVKRVLNLFSPPYTALYNLEKAGLIESRWSDRRLPIRGYARARYYRLTQKGMKEPRLYRTCDWLPWGFQGF
jgi:DNA-binding PadR family transcriptional regulator